MLNVSQGLKSNEMVRGIFLSKYWADRSAPWKDPLVFSQEPFIHYTEEMSF